MSEISLTLTVGETQSLLNVLGDLPTKAGVYPLVQKILEQAQAQVKPTESTEE